MNNNLASTRDEGTKFQHIFDEKLSRRERERIRKGERERGRKGETGY